MHSLVNPRLAPELAWQARPSLRLEAQLNHQTVIVAMTSPKYMAYISDGKVLS